jgi:hypothetical protein
MLAGHWISGIAAADISLWGYGNNKITNLGDFDVDICARATAFISPKAIATGDHDIADIDTTTVYSSKNTTSLSTSAWNEWVFASVPPEIQDGNILQMSQLTEWDTDNDSTVPDSNWSINFWSRWYQDSADGTNPHYLEVTFEVGETAGQFIQGGSNETAASSVTTDSWTPNANEKCYLFVYMAYTDALDANPAVSGNGLTWTLKEGPGASSVHPHLLYEGSAEASPTTGVITVTPESPDTVLDWQWTIFQSNRYQDYVQSDLNSVSNSTTAGAGPTLPANRAVGNLVILNEAWRHSGETAGPFTGATPNNTYNISPLGYDVAAISSAFNLLLPPDPERDHSMTVVSSTWDAPGAVVRKTGLAVELKCVDDDVSLFDFGRYDSSNITSFTTASWTPQANFDTYLWVYVRTTTANDGDVTVSGNGHTWTEVFTPLWLGASTNHGFHLFKGTGGTTTGVTTITAAGTDEMNKYRYLGIEVPDEWTVTQSKTASGTSASADFDVDATFDASTDSTNRIVLGFYDGANVDEEIVVHAPLDVFAMEHEAGSGTMAIVMDSDGGAYTLNRVEVKDNSGTLKYALHVMEFAQITVVAKIVSEALNMVEAAAKVLGPVKIVNEALNMVEATAKVLGFNKIVSEALNMVEGTVKVLGLGKVVNEALNMVENAVIWRLFSRVVDETLNLVESAPYSTIDILVKILYDSIHGTRILMDRIKSTRTLQDDIQDTRVMK